MRSYGCKLFDRHPEHFELVQTKGLSIPPALEYKQIFAPVDDQGDYATCVAHATKSVLDAVIGKRTGKLPGVSWRGIYSLTKWSLEATDLQDDGLAIEDALNCIEQFGYALESTWSDDAVTEANIFEQVPPLELLRFDTFASWQRVAISPDTLARALVAKGPIVIGLDWPLEWEIGVGADGVLSPTASIEAGGHCVVLTGYVNKGGVYYFRLRNSWGTAWGLKGYAWLPATALGRITNAYAVHIP